MQDRIGKMTMALSSGGGKSGLEMEIAMAGRDILI